MVLLYSRDELAEPLRQLAHVMLWVANRDFLPDADRSGWWVNHPTDALGQLQPPARVKQLPPGVSAGNVLKLTVGEPHPPRNPGKTPPASNAAPAAAAKAVAACARGCDGYASAADRAGD